MREFQERRRTKKLLHSRYAIVFLIFLIILLSRSVWSVYVKYKKSENLAEKSRTELNALKLREESLAQSIEDLATTEGREKEFRDRFGVVRPGEKLVILVDNPHEVKPSANVLNDSWWSKLLDAIGL